MSAVLNDPLQLTPLERWRDELLRFENRERAFQQSAATRNGERAPIPPRRSIPKELSPP